MSFAEYERRLQLGGWEPNFFVSREYVTASRWEVGNAGGVLAVFDGDQMMLPPVDEGGLLIRGNPWADYEGYQGDGEQELMDVQFIYDPISFEDLSGGKREVFRKNTRKFAKAHPGLVYREAESVDELLSSFGLWLDEEREVYDVEGIMRYLDAADLSRVRILTDGSDLIGANVWDENFCYINFRYSFVDPSVRFASEYIRLLFYLDMRGRGKLVNDGGSLGSDRLHRFKSRLGPERIGEIHTWKGKEDD